MINPDQFPLARKTLAEKRKKLKQNGLGNRKNAAVSLSEEQVEEMWGRDILSDKTPVYLQRTIFYYFSLCFGFRVELIERKDEAGTIIETYLMFTEKDAKTRTGEYKGISTQKFN